MATPVIAMPYRSQEDATVESLVRDPAYAAEYRKAVIEDGDPMERQLVRKRIFRPLDGKPVARRQD